jgi:hypothetical protein
MRVRKRSLAGAVVDKLVASRGQGLACCQCGFPCQPRDVSPEKLGMTVDLV